MVEMEKVCPKCHKTYNNMKAKFCINCATELIAREKPAPIPQGLRHKILVRDGYRCRECGKSREETSLEIDHIYPRSKGGPTKEDNLWVLCRTCNQAKKDDIWIDDEIEITRNALSNLENIIYKAEEDLKFAESEEKEFALKAKIKRIKVKEIPEEELKLNRLIEEEKIFKARIKEQQKENKRREHLFNKLYVQIEGELLLEVCNHFSLTEKSDDDNIRLLIDKHDENEIFNVISSIKNKLAAEKIRKEKFDKIYNTLSDEEIRLFKIEFTLTGSKSKVVDYLIDKYSEDEIDSLKIKLVEKEQKRVEEERKRKLFDKLNTTLSENEIELIKKEFSLKKSKSEIINYLIDNYTEDKIESIRSKLVKQEEERIEEERKRKLFDKLNTTLSENEIELIKKEFSLKKSKSEIINYLIDNYTEDKIDSLRVELTKKEQEALQEKERQLEHLNNILDFKIMNKACKKFNFTEKNYVNDFIKELKPLPHEKVNAIYKYIMEFY